MVVSNSSNRIVILRWSKKFSKICSTWVAYSDTDVSVVVLCCDQLAFSDPVLVRDGRLLPRDSVIVSSEELDVKDRSDGRRV